MIDGGEPLHKHETYYLSKPRQDFEKNGAGIVDEEIRDDFKQTQESIKDLTREALKNLNGNGAVSGLPQTNYTAYPRTSLLVALSAPRSMLNQLAN